MKQPTKAQRQLACLGDPSRFRVVGALLAGERCVSDLAAVVGLSQSCTTRHLQALRREGVVRGKRDGKRVMFRLLLEDPRIAALIQWVASPSRRPAGEKVRGEEAARVDSSDPGAPDGRKSRGVAGIASMDRVEASDSEPEPEAEGQVAPVPRRTTDLEDFLL